MLRGMSGPDDVVARVAAPPLKDLAPRSLETTRRTALAPEGVANVDVTFKCDPALAGLLDSIAGHLGISRGETIRRLLMRGAERVLDRREAARVRASQRSYYAGLRGIQESEAPDAQVVVRAIDAARAAAAMQPARASSTTALDPTPPPS